MGSNPQKPLQSGHEQAIFSQFAEIIKLRYYQNYWTDLNQSLYNDKDPQEHIAGGPAHEYNKSKMEYGRHIENIKFVITPRPCNRDGRHVGNWSFAISPQPFIRPKWNFARTCRLGLQTSRRLKFAYCENSRWRTAAILETENSQHFRNRSTDRGQILHERADFGCKSCEILKFAYFRNSRWRTAAISEIEYLQYFHNRSTYHDKLLQEHADCGCKSCEILKFAYFRNSICRTAAMLEIEYSLYLRNRLSD